MLDPSTALDPSILLGAGQRADKKSSGKGIDAEALAADDKNKASNGIAATNDEQDPERKKELEEAEKEERERAMRAHQLQQKSGEKDVSKHTFYIVNSQMRLKLSARNEVRSNSNSLQTDSDRAHLLSSSDKCFNSSPR
jgi:hypothetical protein